MKLKKKIVALCAASVMLVGGCFGLTGCSFDELENLLGGLEYEFGGLTGETNLKEQDEAAVEMMIKVANNIRGNLMLIGQDSEEAVKSLSMQSAKVKYQSGTGSGIIYCKLSYKYSGMTEISYCSGTLTDYNKISNFKTMTASQWSADAGAAAGEGYKWATVNIQNINKAYDYYLENGTY